MNDTHTIPPYTNLEERAATYRQQLLDPRWRALRQRIMQRDGKRCRCCGTPHQLQVHHRQYHVHAASGSWKSPWAYADHLLVTLCEPCHKRGHRHYKVPVFELNG